MCVLCVCMYVCVYMCVRPFAMVTGSKFHRCMSFASAYSPVGSCREKARKAKEDEPGCLHGYFAHGYFGY